MKYTEELEGMVVNIGDHYYTIHFQEDMERRFERLGQADPLKGLIWLEAMEGERITLSVLLHEVLETMIVQNNIPIEHRYIVVLENCMFRFCMQNPKIMDILKREALEKSGSNGVPPEEMNLEDIPEVEKIMKVIDGGGK